MDKQDAVFGSYEEVFGDEAASISSEEFEAEDPFAHIIRQDGAAREFAKDPNYDPNGEVVVVSLY